MPELSQMFARAAAAASGFAASLLGCRGVFTALARDHAALRTLLGRVITADGDDLRRAVLEEARREFCAQNRAKEAELYPVMARIADTRELAARGAETDRELERRLDALAGRDVGAAGWLEEFAEVAAAVEDHLAEEERRLLWRCREVVDDDHAEAMEELYARAKAAAAADWSQRQSQTR